MLNQLTWSRSQGSPLEPWQGAVCGAIAGGTAAAITTPLDVAKTRIMLAKVHKFVVVILAVYYVCCSDVSEKKLTFTVVTTHI